MWDMLFDGLIVADWNLPIRFPCENLGFESQLPALRFSFPSLDFLYSSLPDDDGT